MSLVDDILSCLQSKISQLGDIVVNRVILGWGYAAVQLSTSDVGLCHSLLGEASPACCQIVQRAGTLAGSPATQLTRLAKSWDIGEKVIGIATVNALSQIVLKRRHEEYTVSEGNAIDEVNVEQTDSVAIVGDIKPLVRALRNRTADLKIFERGVPFAEDVLPDTACEELLPEADIVFITGSAIANGTIERLLQLSKNARTVAIVGPSASTVPEPFFKRGVHVIAGVIVTDPDRAMQVVAEGGGTPQLKAATRFVVVKPS